MLKYRVMVRVLRANSSNFKELNISREGLDTSNKKGFYVHSTVFCAVGSGPSPIVRTTPSPTALRTPSLDSSAGRSALVMSPLTPHSRLSSVCHLKASDPLKKKKKKNLKASATPLYYHLSLAARYSLSTSLFHPSLHRYPFLGQTIHPPAAAPPPKNRSSSMPMHVGFRPRTDR